MCDDKHAGSEGWLKGNVVYQGACAKGVDDSRKELSRRRDNDMTARWSMHSRVYSQS
jgi:hypothetical protein